MTVTCVLVTGASGFIAQYCIAELLRSGYAVRGTLRNLARAGDVRAAVARAGADAGPMEFTAADLLNDAGWDQAVAGCSHVLHVASPFPLALPRRRDDLILPARDGTLRVLGAATRAGVQRVVLTSSIAAIIYPSSGEQEREYSEADWTDPTRTDISAYIASKAIAEKAAWDYVRSTKGAPELAVLNPGFVHGPALSRELASSHDFVRQLATGVHPIAPRAGFSIVDVRDVATAHVVAMTHPKAAGERFLVTDRYMTFMDMGQAIAAALPDLARKTPIFTAPDIFVRAFSYLDRNVQGILPDLGVRRTCSSRKAREVLGIRFRSPDEAVKSAATSLRALGMI